MALRVFIEQTVQLCHKIHSSMYIARILITHQSEKRIFKIILYDRAVVSICQMIPKSGKFLKYY